MLCNECGWTNVSRYACMRCGFNALDGTYQTLDWQIKTLPGSKILSAWLKTNFMLTESSFRFIVRIHSGSAFGFSAKTPLRDQCFSECVKQANWPESQYHIYKKDFDDIASACAAAAKQLENNSESFTNSITETWLQIFTNGAYNPAFNRHDYKKSRDLENLKILAKSTFIDSVEKNMPLRALLNRLEQDCFRALPRRVKPTRSTHAVTDVQVASTTPKRFYFGSSFTYGRSWKNRWTGR